MHRSLMARWHALPIDADVKAFKSLVDLINKTANLSAQLATKLRLTQQSRYTPQAANTAAKKAKPSRPWERQAG